MEKLRHRTIIISDIRQKITTINREAHEEWEKKQAETEKSHKVNEANKDEDDKMRATTANVAVRTATGVGDMLSRWQSMIEAKQKLEGTESSQPGKDVAQMPIPTSTRNTRENQELEKRDHSTALSTLGSKIDLASVRARKATFGRRSPPAGNRKVHVNRVHYTSHDLIRREVSSVRTESARGSKSHDPKKASSSLSNRDSDSRAAKGDRTEAEKKVHDEVQKKAEEEEARQPKKSRVEDLGASSKPSLAKHIFVDGVNRKEKADSFWYLDDPEIGSKKGRGIVGDFDMLHLLSLSTDSFANAFSWNSCQGLSLASAVRVREEKLQNEKDKLREEVHRLKDENRLLSEEKKKRDAELLQVRRDLAGKVTDFVVLEEKYVLELKTGGHFLGSEAGEAFLKNVEEKSVRSFKASSVFHEDVLDQAITIHDDVVLACRDQLRKNGVSEEIVMLIEPSVLEVNAISTDDIPLRDAEMIDALKSRSIDDEA